MEIELHIAIRKSQSDLVFSVTVVKWECKQSYYSEATV